jgi:hypothetical protein
MNRVKIAIQKLIEKVIYIDLIKLKLFIVLILLDYFVSLEKMNLKLRPFSRALLMLMLGFGHWVNQFTQEKIENTLQWIPYRCPLKWITGLKCAFCGMTHSWIAIFRGDFRQSFAENVLGLPLFVVLITVLTLWSLGKEIKIQKFVWITVVVLMLFYAVLRNVY